MRKYLTIGVGGGVMLMSKVSVSLRYTLTYTRCSTPVVTLETGAPSIEVGEHFVCVWALGPRCARLVAQRLLLWARPLSSIQRFQGGLRLWLRRPEKVGLNTSRTRSVCINKSLTQLALLAKLTQDKKLDISLTPAPIYLITR